MPIAWPKLFDFEGLRLGPPIAWAIGVAAIMSVFAVVAIIANYAPLNSDAEQRVKARLTPATYETIAVLVQATGNACARVCSVSAVNSLAPSSSLDVACAASSDIKACRTPVIYRVNVAPETRPRR